jgi:hypothetical protein
LPSSPAADAHDDRLSILRSDRRADLWFQSRTDPKE